MLIEGSREQRAAEAGALSGPTAAGRSRRAMYAHVPMAGQHASAAARAAGGDIYISLEPEIDDILKAPFLQESGERRR